MALTTSSGVTPVVQGWWDRIFLRRAQQAIVHGRVAQRRSLKRREGQQMRFRRYNPFNHATAPLTEGIPPTADSLSYTDITTNILQYGAFEEHTDFIEATQDHPLINEVNALQAQQSSETIDVLLREEAASGTAVDYGGTAAGRATIVGTGELIDTEILLKAIRTLQNENGKMFNAMVKSSTGVGTVPVRPGYIAICSPAVIFDIEKKFEAGNFAGWTSVEKYGSQGQVLPNEVGAFHEIRFVMSTLAKTFPGLGGTATNQPAPGPGNDVQVTGANPTATVDIHTVLIFAMDAIATVPLEGKSIETIMHPIGSAGTADPLNQRGTLGWKHTGARKRLNENWLMRLEVAVSV